MELGCKSVGIIGAGASGCVCAYFLLKAGINVTLFDCASPLNTLLPTGGGRCNIAHAEYDFKNLAQNYPRGEKFLYSIFSKFSTYDTIALFEEMGIETYIQPDNRIFPTSNSSKDVQKKILNKINRANKIRERVTNVRTLDNGFKVDTSNNASYFFSHLVVASGGKIYPSFMKNLRHHIIEFRPSLVGLNTNKIAPSGIIIKNVYSKDFKIYGDILFTHFGISGPLCYKISSLKAFEEFPYLLTFDLYPVNVPLQELLNNNPHKEVKNILAKFLPINFVKFILADLAEVRACTVNGMTRDLILNTIHNYTIQINGTNKGEETVSAGGIDTNEINPQTLESKLYSNLYFAGEVINIDGFCGGYNLQNAWSTAYVASNSIISA